MNGRKVEGSKDGKEGGVQEWRKGKRKREKRMKEEVKKGKRGSTAGMEERILGSALFCYLGLGSNAIVRRARSTVTFKGS